MIATSFDIHDKDMYDSGVNQRPFTVMSKRIDIVLPDATLSVLDRVTTKGSRS